MYRYKVIKSYNNKWNFNKARIKFSLPAIFILLGIMNVLILTSWIIISRLTDGEYLYIFVLCILLEVILFITGYIKCMNDSFYSMDDKEQEIYFNEEGIKVICENNIEKISWKAVKDVKIYDEYMIVSMNLMYRRLHIFLFDSFDTDKQIIIKEIEKYKQVARRE